MASGSSLHAFQRQYTSLSSNITQFHAIHATLLSAVDRVLALTERIRLLSDEHATHQREQTATSATTAHLAPFLIAKTLKTLTALATETVPSILDELHGCLGSMGRVERQATELLTRLQKSAGSASSESLSVRNGPVPSVRACVDGVAEIVGAYEREGRLCDLVGALTGRVVAGGGDEEEGDVGAGAGPSTVERVYTGLVDVLRGMQGRVRCTCGAGLNPFETMHLVLATKEQRFAL